MNRLFSLLCLVAALALTSLAPAQGSSFVEPAKPAKAKLEGVKVGGTPAANEVAVPMITWGGDAATLLGNGGKDTKPESLFGKAGLKLKLYKQDDPVAQVKDYLEGKTPFLRGTMGMINTYTEITNFDARTRPVVILQLTWSTGGDCLVARESVKSTRDLRGKTVLLQQYGPHVEYMDQVLRDAGLQWTDVKIKWCEELFDLDGKPNDPASIMRVDPSIDAVFCISPDAAALTSNMTTGTGAEGSVKGARVLLTTKSASRIIADVYAVRKDFFDANKPWVEKFVRAHFDAQALVNETAKKKDSKEYTDLLKLGADVLLDSPDATADMEGLLADCTFALGPGNYDYFANAGNLVGFEPTVKRNQSWLVAQGYVTAAQTLGSAGWDFAKFGVTGSATPAVQFKQEAAAKAAANIADTNILFEFEIFFEPNQKEFDEKQYGAQFQRALELASTYSGALLEIVGHSDPRRFNTLMAENPTPEVVTRQKQAGLVLSQNRAQQVRNALFNYAKGKTITVNETQFISTGRGYDDPKVKTPQTTTEMAQNRRVQFRIINIESEAGELIE
jgi:ABC-type nitrate/sulfonate/bicarbonate transport system substrate-binding protein/outer membrane protein OmpA-like peptidoglycan-associated protein